MKTHSNSDQHRNASLDKVKVTLNVVTGAENLSQIITLPNRFEDLHSELPTTKKLASQMPTQSIEAKVHNACAVRSQINDLCKKELDRIAF